MGRFVIVAYRPKLGMEGELKKVVARHLRVLAEQGLVSEKEAYVMKGEDATIVEVFEWKSSEAIEKAHANQAVLELWEEFAKVCDYVPLGELPEAGRMFAEFEPVEL